MAEVQPDIQGFLRAARQRFRASKVLLEHGEVFDADYLLGYVAELSMKAVLLAATPQSRWRELRDELFSGSEGHNLDRLRHSLEQKGRYFSPTLLRSLRVISSRWTPEMRYLPGAGDPRTTREMSEAALALLEWAQRST